MTRFSSHVVAEYLIQLYGINKAELAQAMTEYYNEERWFLNRTANGRVTAVQARTAVKITKPKLSEKTKKTKTKTAPAKRAKTAKPPKTAHYAELTSHAAPVTPQVPVVYRRKKVIL